MSVHVAQFDSFKITDDRQRIDFLRVHGWLASSYWAKDIPQERLRRGIENSSLVAGVYHPEFGQCAFARVVTDFARFAYLMDVFVAPDNRSQGLGKQIVRFLLDHPRMSDIDSWAHRMLTDSTKR